MIRFAVDDVALTPEPPRTRPLGEVLGERLALGLDADTPVLADPPSTHALLGAVHVAFAEHRPLALSPDAVWLTVAQGLARHVRLSPGAVDGRLARHEGNERLEVEHGGPFPTDSAGAAALVRAMTEALGRETDEGLARLFRCDFSTSTEVERVASEIVLLDACSPAYDHRVACVGGIPTITLTGTAADWRAIRARVEVVSELVAPSAIAAWGPALASITDRLVAAAEGVPDRAFFQRMYKPRRAHCWDRVTGWIAWLYPYVGANGCHETPSPVLAHDPIAPLPGEDASRSFPVGPGASWTGPGIGLQDVPADLAQRLFRIVDRTRGTRLDVTLHGGLGAITADAEGVIAPRALWWCERGAPSLDELGEAIERGSHASERSRRAPSSGPAEPTAPRERFATFALAGDAQPPRFPFTPPGPLVLEHDVPLAPSTTLELGGPARALVRIRSEDEVAPALAWAEARGLPVFVLGGGSNLVVADAGFDGLVLAMESRGIATLRAEGSDGMPRMRVTAAAGEPWDAFVALTVQHGWQGLECLSGIPGLVGATPVQNVGAYGQEVADTIVAVGVVDRRTKLARTLAPSECAFGYRDSALKRAPDRFVVTSVTFELRVGAPPALRYAELQRALAGSPAPTLADVREAVIALRRKKSMVSDPCDPNRRSAGSFFTNPIVSSALAERVIARALEQGLVADASAVPRWPEKDGRVKLAAAWLIERAGIEKGLRRGAVGVSSAHALALVHHGGGTTKDLLALADEIRARVHDVFGVTLEREPVLVGG